MKENQNAFVAKLGGSFLDVLNGKVPSVQIDQLLVVLWGAELAYGGRVEDVDKDLMHATIPSSRLLTSSDCSSSHYHRPATGECGSTCILTAIDGKIVSAMPHSS